MRRMWSVLGAGLIAGVVLTPLLSCDVIHGDLELLLEEQGDILSPRWGSDGEYIYYIHVTVIEKEYGSLWRINVSTKETERITDNELEVTQFDLSPDDSEICFSNLLISTGDGSIVDSLPLDSMYYSPARFSPFDPNLIYYLGKMNDSLTLCRFNRSDESDEILLTLPMPERLFCFVISSDEEYALIGNTIYAIDDGSSTVLDRLPNSADWHPTDPNIFVCTTLEEENSYYYTNRDIYFYDLSEDEWSRAKVNPYHPSRSNEVSYSPDGERIAVTSRQVGGEFNSFALWLFEASN